MVDVDQLAREFVAKPVRQNLHEACENTELDFFITQDLCNLLKTIVLLITIHIDMVKGDAFFFCDFLAVIAVADDRGYL